MTAAELPFTEGAAVVGGVRAGYGASLTDIAAFEQSIARAQAGGMQGGVTVQPPLQVAPSPAMQALFKPLERINAEASRISSSAEEAAKGSGALTPGEMVNFSVKVHEFMFNCQITSNAANRASDGLQQLFRQQS